MHQKTDSYQVNDFFFSVVEHGEKSHTGAYRKIDLDALLAEREAFWSSELDGGPADLAKAAYAIAYALGSVDDQRIRAAHSASLLLVRRMNEVGLREAVAAGGAVIASAEITKRQLGLRVVERTDPRVAAAIANISAQMRATPSHLQ
jgi:hypothetical protein